MRILILILLLGLALPFTATAKKKDKSGSQTDSQQIETTWSTDAPLLELSGLAWRQKGTAERELIAIGDRGFDLALIPWPLNSNKADSPNRTTTRLVPFREAFGKWESNFKRLKHSQWEGVASDKSGRVFLLRESPPTIFVTNPELTEIEKRMDLVAPEAGPLSKLWLSDPASVAEGFVLLKNGNILVAKEKNPPLLVEFAPEGGSAQGVTSSSAVLNDVFQLPSSDRSQYRAVAHWTLHDSGKKPIGDISDLTVGPKGELFFVSGKSQRIVQIRLPLESRNPAATIATQWKWNSRSKGQPEGLALTPDGEAVVGLDQLHSQDGLLMTRPLKMDGLSGAAP